MATTKNLNAVRCESLTEPGRYPDQTVRGLTLRVFEGGQKRWTLYYRFEKKPREIGLGRYGARLPDLTLAEARKKAQGILRMVADGIDPQAPSAPEATVPTFGEYADAFAATRAKASRNAKHQYQWRQTLGATYCGGIRDKHLDEITLNDVRAVLEPHWNTKAETAKRLRTRLRAVFKAAMAEGYVTGANPAGEAIDALLGARSGGERGPQEAVPWEAMPEFWRRLVGRKETSGNLALRFLILTAARTSEVTGATWGEIDLGAKLWRVPGSRMKAGQGHDVPLSDAALEVLEKAKALNRVESGRLIFPGQPWQKPMSINTLLKAFRTMGQTETVHGFRSSFRDWAGDATDYPREVAEAALAHVVGGVEGAYRRGSAIAKRRLMMVDWADYLTGFREISAANAGKPQGTQATISA